MSRFYILIANFTLILVACSSQSASTDATLTSPEPTLAEALVPTTSSPGNTISTDQYLSSDLESFQIIPNESEVTYEVGEVFLNQNNRFNVAVGSTAQVSGEILVDRNNPQNSTICPISVDISQFKSDSGMRDRAIRERFLESAKFPIVIFFLTEIQGLPESYKEGQQVDFQVVGNVTIREVTLPVTFDVSLVCEGNTLNGEASAVILMSDFGFGPISIGGILNTKDEVKIKFIFTAHP